MTAKKSTTVRDIILLISVPLALIAILAAVVYVPRWMANPSYDFIYSVCESYRCSQRASVTNGVLVIEERGGDSNVRFDDPSLQLRYYDVSERSSRALTAEEAQQFKLDSASRSPDGYTLTRESSSSGFLFWSDSSSGWVLKDGLRKKSVELERQYSYGNSITFIGWVE